MKNSKSLVFISICGMLIAATLAVAADLSGCVKVRGAPVAGAVVTANLVSARSAASVAVTRTDPQGNYALRGLPNGDYILLVDIEGRRVYQGRIAVANSRITKNIDLQ
jgi:Carboxypeptidase regulatory-like domain